MQSDTDRKGIRSTRRPRLDVDIGPESNDLAIVQRSKDARGVERGEHDAGNYQSPQQADLQNRRRQDGIHRQASLLYTPPHSGTHRWRVWSRWYGRGLLFGKTNFGCPPTLYGKSREIGAMLLYRCDVATELPRWNIAWRLMPS
jgi:hypothetical protein